MKAKCSCCKGVFPDHLIQPVVMSGYPGRRPPLACGVCALELIRIHTGLPDFMFRGEVAVSIYEESLPIYQANVDRKLGIKRS